MKNEKFVCAIGEVVRETEKAVMVNAKVELMHKDVVVGVWIAKSQIQDGKVQPWLMNAKIREITSKFGYVQSVQF